MGRPQPELLNVFVRVTDSPLVEARVITIFFAFVQAQVCSLSASLNDSVHMVSGQVASLQSSGSMSLSWAIC